MKVCIIIAGQPRYSRQTINNIEKNIIDSLSRMGHNLTICCSTDKKYLDRWKILKFSIPFFIFESSNHFFSKSNFYLNQTSENQKHFNQVRNLLSSVNSALKISNFDVFLKLRSDFDFNEPFPDLIECKDKRFCVANFEVQNNRPFTENPGFIEDQVYYGNPNLIQKILDGIMYDKNFGYDVNHGIEKQLYNYCCFYDIEVVPFDFRFIHERELYREFEHELSTLPDNESI